MASGDVLPNKKIKRAPCAVIPELPVPKRKLLRDAILVLDDDVAFGFTLLKITKSNIEMCASFSDCFPENDCFLQFERSVDKCPEGEQDVYDFAGVFEKGVNVLKLYLDDPDMVPEDGEVWVAIQRLMQTILKSEDIGNKLSKKMSPRETGWRVCLVHHLLKELSVNQQYRIDAFFKDKTDKCICCKEPLRCGGYGDCSIGNSEVWHGCVDILLGLHPDVAIYAKDSDDPFEADQDGGLSSFEVNEHSDLLGVSTQIIAETIVFAFLQKQKNPAFENFLIPTVGLSRKNIVFYLYDPDHDFLLESPQFEIFHNKKLSYPAVLALWLILNYKIFCTGITEAMRESNFTADVLSKVTNDIKILYKDHLQFGNCAIGTKKRQPYIPKRGFGFQLRKSNPVKRTFNSFNSAP